MLINFRNALMAEKRIPYDAEVEYLESTGTQWIDTGVYGNSDTVAELSFAMTDSARSDAGIFGSRKGYQQDCFTILRVASSQGAFWMHYGNERTSANYISTVIGNTTAWHTARLARSWNIDTSTGTAGQYTFTTPTTLKVFAADISASGRWYAKMRLASLKIYDANNVLVRDYIPVRKGTVGYLYDRVSGKLFGNAGTGDFVLGTDVVPVEYLQSDGGQYIQTDFTPDDSYGFEVDCFTPVASSSYNSRAIGLQNGQVRWLYCTERRASSDSFFGWNEAVLVGNQSDKRIVARCNWLNNRTISIGDTVYKSNLATLGSMGGLKAVLFGINNGGSVLTSQLFVGKMYSAKVSIGNAIGYNYTPVRVGTEGAMMDVLTRRIYRNAGTGAFTYGDDLKYPIPA